MKKILIITIILAGFISSCHKKKEASDLVKSVENSFISEKESSILKCYPNKDQFNEIYEIMNNNTDISNYLYNKISKSLQLKYGYYALKNTMTNNENYHNKITELELEYFESHPVYS